MGLNDCNVLRFMNVFIYKFSLSLLQNFQTLVFQILARILAFVFQFNHRTIAVVLSRLLGQDVNNNFNMSFMRGLIDYGESLEICDASESSPRTRVHESITFYWQMVKCILVCLISKNFLIGWKTVLNFVETCLLLEIFPIDICNLSAMHVRHNQGHPVTEWSKLYFFV